jgi:adenylate cyclase
MTTPRPPLTRIHLLAVILALLIALNGASLNLFSSLDHALSDVFVRKVAATLLPDPDIVIVDIDEKSITAMQDVAGSWPWPRAVHGELLEGIAKQKPAAIVFDLLFSEPDRYRPESDQMFNDTLRDMHNVYLPMLQMEGDQSTGVPLAELAKVTDIPHRADADPNARAILLAPQAVDPKSWRVGLINFSEDKKDGIGRRYDVRRNIGGWYLESLPARLMRDLGVKVPEQDDIILHWRGGNSPYKHISYSDLYADQSREHPVRDAHELSGKIVIIGSSATGLHDIRATPISSLYSGTEILATAIDDLKNQRHTRAPPAFLAPLLAMLLMLLQLPLFARRMDASRIGAILLATSMTLLALQSRSIHAAAVRLAVLLRRGTQRISAREKIARTDHTHVQPLPRSARSRIFGRAGRDTTIAERASARHHRVVLRYTRLHHHVREPYAGADCGPAQPLFQSASRNHLPSRRHAG